MGRKRDLFYEFFLYSSLDPTEYVLEPFLGVGWGRSLASISTALPKTMARLQEYEENHSSPSQSLGC